jgi:hypothetical protein
MMDELNCSCNSARNSLWEFAADAKIEPPVEVASHLESCRVCRREQAEMSVMRQGLKSLPQRGVSPLLAMKLRVMASRESSRQRRRVDLETRWNEFLASAKLFFDNLLRPLAVPAAGGLLSSFFCFGLMLNSLHIGPTWQNDIPVGLFTHVAVDEVSPFYAGGKDVIVQITVDANGAVSDWLPLGSATPEEMQEIGNLVLYSTFTPATAFGQRVAGKILVGIQHINIKG